MNHTTATQPLLAPDANVPHRDILLDPSRMADCLSTHLSKNGKLPFDDCRIARIKYRFGKNLRVLYDVKLNGQNLRIASRTFAAECASSVFRDFLSRAKDNGTTRPRFFDDELKAIFWVFPNDRKIKNLHVLSELPPDLAEHVPGWTSSRLIAYAPEKCATAQCLDNDGNTIAYAKVFSENSARNIFEIYRHFGGAGSSVPTALAFSAKYKTLISRAVTGVRIADLPSEQMAEGYRELGASIARFHMVVPTNRLPFFERTEHQALLKVFRALTGARPDIENPATRLLTDLMQQVPAGRIQMCLHADIHAKNAIWNDGELTLIDLDQAAIGDPACDIGSLLAGLQYKECIGETTAETRNKLAANFLSGYESLRALPANRSLRWHTAAAMFTERCGRAIGRFRVEGLKELPELLATAERVLEGSVI